MTTVALEHRTTYRYDRAVYLSSHVVRLRPAPQCRTPVLRYALAVKPANHHLSWQQDPFGNHLARLVFPERTDELAVDVELVAELVPLNPFDFFVEDWAREFPFAYDEGLERDLSPYLYRDTPGPLLLRFLASLPTAPEPTVQFLSSLNRHLFEAVRYTTRLEAGVQTPDETLEKSSGSCRDSAVLLVQVLRHLGLAARFVSGYLVQLAEDPDAADELALHAWADVFVPGAGWVGLDPTSGLFATEGHLPLAAAPTPAGAAPITGTTERCEATIEFVTAVTRV
jgi:transglutaminase-like putative cysteine protease